MLDLVVKYTLNLYSFILDVENLIMEHMVKTNNEEGLTMWMCSVCGKSGSHKNSIKAHVQTHLNVKQMCPHCGKPSKNKESLRCHIRIYHKEIFEVSLR